jgi:DNA-directed RNA polymerase specialized sigma24 family protein
MVYCVVPPDVGLRLRRLVQRTLAGHPSVVVVEERRARDRRVAPDRRCAGASPAVCLGERRHVHHPDGRRVAKRRAALVPVVAPELPGKLRSHTDRLAFLGPLEVPAEAQDDIGSVRAIVRLQSGEQDAFVDLYRRWFDRIYTYLRLTIDDRAELDSRVCAVFAEALREAEHLMPSIADVRPWLFGLAYQIAQESTAGPVTLGGPSPAAGGAVKPGSRDGSSLEWLSDDDLLLLIERRPLAERHVLLLGYLGALRREQIAEIMGLDPDRVRDLHRQALASIDASLAAIVRSPRMAGRLPMSRLDRGSRVLDRRRRALLAA